MFDTFARSIPTSGTLEWIQSGLIGDRMVFDTPDGPRRLVYADYVASGRALRQIEHFMLEFVLPVYANTHSDASYCGEMTTRLREDARQAIARHVGATGDHAVIFSGSGATAGINRLVALLGVADAVRTGRGAVVLLGPYEHHSNILPWLESGAEIVHVPEAADGGPDMEFAAAMLERHADAAVRVAAFSAASNVSGILADVARITRQVKQAGALMVWDYAAAAPYVSMALDCGEGAEIDAIVFSPHKFPGGPAASGVLVVRRDAVATARPTWPGGGTVAFVSRWHHDYLENVEAREEAGTPNILGDIRAGLAVAVKDAVGAEAIMRREDELNGRALDAWGKVANLTLLGADRQPRLPIFSFLARNSAGSFVDPQAFTRALSDRYGIQARGGCACAGVYGHALLGIDRAESDALRTRVRAGEPGAKPGWTRLNLPYVLTDETVDYILASVAELAEDADGLPRTSTLAPHPVPERAAI